MATALVRWPICQQFIALLRDQPLLAGVQVEPGWPGDQLAAEAIWVDGMDGQLTLPVMMAGRKIVDDKFLLTIVFHVTNRTDLYDTQNRLSEMVSAALNVIQNDPGLDNFDGVLDSDPPTIRGPVAALSPEGHVGYADLTVNVHSRIN